MIRRMRVGKAVVALLIAASVPLAARAESISELFKRVKDTVVVIRTSERAAPDRPGMMAAAESGLGSGVVIGQDTVLTAAHVVQVAEQIFVEMPSGETLQGHVAASEPSADLALVKLERVPANVVVAKLGDSDAVGVGDEVFIVGAPLGMSHTLTAGHISGRRTSHGMYGGFSGGELLQTDASINPGNSGGPMFDMHGNVIGIVSHIIFEQAGAGGLGFVATSNMAAKLLLSGKNAWSGMESYLLEGDMARIFQLPQARGLLVQRVADNSPAAKLGLMPGKEKATIGDESFVVGGDVILEVLGISFADADALPRIRAALSALPPGKPVSVIVLRGGRRLELEWTPPK
jgi:S1-C subfamily serine protease